MKPYLLYYSIFALSALEIGGNFVMRIDETYHYFTSDVIELVALNFKEVVIYRPVSIDSSIGSRYVVFMD
jgi:hypothetical protein